MMDDSWYLIFCNQEEEAGVFETLNAYDTGTLGKSELGWVKCRQHLLQMTRADRRAFGVQVRAAWDKRYPRRD